MKFETSILNTIGNTPLIELSHIVPEGNARILVKLEGQNPTGSMKDRMANEVIQVSTEETKDMSRRLAREEALFAGTSTGANVVAAIKLAGRFGEGHTIATIACDAGLKYLSGDLYSLQ